jgi:O-antigen/teichoic acid export membrane protein
LLNLKTKAAEGVSYGLAGRIIVGSCQALTGLAAARYLTPFDFGIVAFAMVYINFLAQFSDFGISTAVVQKGDGRPAVLHTAFTIKVALGFALTTLGVVLGMVIGFFGAPHSGYVVSLLASTFIIGSVYFIPHILLTLNLDYLRLFIGGSLSALVSTAVGIYLLVEGWGYWAIALGYISAVLTSAVYFNAAKPSRYRLSWDWGVGRPLVAFGAPIFITGIIGFFVTYAGNLTIGIFSGPESLGLYAIALTFSFMIVNQIGGILSVLFPLYSKVREDQASLRLLFVHSLDYTLMVAVLLNVGMISLAEPFLFLVLGGGTAKWMPALLAFKILCLSGIFMAALFTVPPLVVAMGNPRIQLRAVASSALIQAVFVVPALYYRGIEGVAVVTALGAMVQVAVYLPTLRAGIGVGSSDIVRAVGPSFIAGIAMFTTSRLFYSAYSVDGATETGIFIMAFQALILLAVFLIVHGLLTRWRLLTQFRGLARKS